MDEERKWELQNEANVNLNNLIHNRYPGRLVIGGMTEDGVPMLATAAMGRSADSRNRVYEQFGDRLCTAPADPSKASNDPNLYYDAMRSNGIYRIASNGNQTDDVYRDCYALNFADILAPLSYETDTIRTPRITALMAVRRDMLHLTSHDEEPALQMSILRKSRFDDSCERHTHVYETLAPGFGYHLSTYAGDGDPPPHFRGEPLLLPITGTSLDCVAEVLWKALNKENRVSLAVRFFTPDGIALTQIINKYVPMGL